MERFLAREYFITANSFAAPFVSDTSDKFVVAETPRAALEQFAAAYTHPAGLYAAECYTDANAFKKGEKPLARWRSNHARRIEAVTRDKGSYGFEGHGPGSFTIDGRHITVENPQAGSIE